MAHIDSKTEREWYEDWKPLLEGQQDAVQAASGADLRLIDEEGYVEQTNNSVGVSADGKFPLAKRPHSAGVRDFIESVEGIDADDC
jgi:hypothetical protein